MKISPKAIAGLVIGAVVFLHVLLATLVLASPWFMTLLVLLVAGDVVWFVVSCCNRIEPDYYAFVEYFGEFNDNKLLGPGLHFIPWFWGIKLLRITTDEIIIRFMKDPKAPAGVMSGNMLGVRVKQGIKAFVEAAIYFCAPWKHPKLLATMIRAGVPIVNKPNKERKNRRRLWEWTERLGAWMSPVVIPHMNQVFGQKEAKDVYGGAANQELDTETNERLRGIYKSGDSSEKVDSFLELLGVLGTDPKDMRPGEGKLLLAIDNVHIEKKYADIIEARAIAVVEVDVVRQKAEAQRVAAEVGIQTAIHQAEAKKRAAEIGVATSKSIGTSEAEETHGRVFKMVALACGIEENKLRGILARNPKLKGTPEKEGGYKEAFDRAYEQLTRETTIVRDIRIGSTDGTSMKDTGLGALAAGAAAFFQQKVDSERPPTPDGGGAQPRIGNGGNPKSSEGKPNETTQEKIDRMKKERGI